MDLKLQDPTYYLVWRDASSQTHLSSLAQFGFIWEISFSYILMYACIALIYPLEPLFLFPTDFSLQYFCLHLSLYIF